MNTMQGQGGKGYRDTHKMKGGGCSAPTPDHEAQDGGSYRQEIKVKED